MALSGERFGPIILECFCLLCFLSVAKTGETYICFGATAKEMEEEWVSDSPISRYEDSPARSLRFVYLSIGGEIA